MRTSTTPVPRKFFEHLHGECNWPRDAAYRQWNGPHGGFSYITWEELHRRRTEHQNHRLANKRHVDPPEVRPAYVWTFYNSCWIYMGWHCYIVTLKEQVGVTFRSMNETLARSIMQAIPCGVLPDVGNFERWMIEFTKRHPRKKPRHDKRKAGVKFGWYDRINSRFTLERPER